VVLLAIPAEQEKDLRLKGIARAVGVKVAEEGVLLKDLQQELGVELGLQQAGKGGLAHADDALDGDVRSRRHGNASCAERAVARRRLG